MALVTALLASSTLGGCSSNEEKVGGQEAEAMYGYVVDVQASSISNVDTLTMEDVKGKVWHFKGKGGHFLGFTPAHLREHKIQGQPLYVSYKEEGEDLVIVGIKD
ncbi:MAG: hypothetical protein HY666_02900 [Chloroflexi bacterium]|nr:hypothetical protein [Chloroflexota bacterium]